MKKNLLLMGFAATTMLASAQQTIYSANNATTFGTWTFVDADGDGNNWAVEDQSSVQGLSGQGDLLTSYSLNPSTFNPLTPNNFASSTPINCTMYENLSLRFKREAAGAPGAEAEKYSIYAISAANQSALTTALLTATPVHTETVAVSRTLDEITVDLSALDGMDNVYIVIRHYDCTGQFFLAIDDVVLEGDMTSASIESNSQDLKASIYPQPMNANLMIELEEEIASVVLLDQNGKIVSQVNDVNAYTATINTENIKSGVYIIKIVSESGRLYSQKCVK